MMFVLIVINVILLVKIRRINVLICTRSSGTSNAKVREEDCVGCNLCSIVCPVDGAISMEEIENQLFRQ